MVRFQGAQTQPPNYDPTAVFAQGAAVQAFATTVSNEIHRAEERRQRMEAARVLTGIDPEAAAFMAAGGDPEVVLGAKRVQASRANTAEEARQFDAKQQAAQQKQAATQAFMQQAPSYFGEDKIDTAGAFGLAGSLGLAEEDVTGTISGLQSGVEARSKQKHFADEERKEAERKKAEDEYYDLIANGVKGEIKTIEAPMGDLVTRAYDESKLSPEQLATLKAMRAEKVNIRYVPGGLMGRLTELGTKGGVPAEAQKRLREQYIGSDVVTSEEEADTYINKTFGSRFDKALPPVSEPFKEGKQDKNDPASIQQRAMKTAQGDPRYMGKQMVEMQAALATDPENEKTKQMLGVFAVNNAKIEHEALMRELDSSGQSQLKPQLGLESALRAKQMGVDKATFFAMLRLAGIDPDKPAGGAAPQQDRLRSLPGVGGKDD